MTFKEFLMQQESLVLRGIDYKPNYIPLAIPSTGYRNSGGRFINPVAVVSPSRPYQPIFRMNGKKRSGIVNKKH